jgi:hypothetical protein
VAVRDAAVSFLSNAAFEAFAEKHSELYKSLVRLLAKRLRETDTTVAASSFLSLKGRMAQTLLELAEHFGQEVEPGRIVIRQKIRIVRSEWRDNPWFTPELEEERQLDLKLYPDRYATSGRASTPGRVLAQAKTQGRTSATTPAASPLRARSDCTAQARLTTGQNVLQKFHD